MSVRKLSLNLVIVFLSISSFAQQQEKDTIKVFFLGGQSNMSGHGYNSELPKELKNKFKNVWIFHGNTAQDDAENGGIGIWEQLQPGHGGHFSSNGINNKLSNRFGVELSFAKRLQELYPNQKIAIIKYAKGGSSIDIEAAGSYGAWEPDYKRKKGINQYDHFLTTINASFADKDIDNDGIEDYLLPSGIIWMQGETDAARTKEIALRYSKNLKRLMDLMRATFRQDDLPVVIGKISSSGMGKNGRTWRHCELVQHEQEKFIALDANASIVRATKYYQYSDAAHYDSKSHVKLGIEFANAIFKLNEKK